MERQDLHQLLETLHAQLQSAEAPAAEDRQLLQDVAHDIQGLLAQSQAGQAPAAAAPVNARLAQAVEQFEVSHPYLTLGLSQLLDTLTRAGL